MTTRNKMKKASVRRRERNQGHGHRRTAPALAWWCTVPADRFKPTEAKVLREAIANVAILGETTFRDAADGDTTAAIGLALRLGPHASPMICDLVMTALAACAAEDSGAASLAMSRAVYDRPGAGEVESRIATSWLIRSFGKKTRSRNRVGDAR
jgi:hypothetical protein